MLELDAAVKAYKEQYIHTAKVNHISIDNVIDNAVESFAEMSKKTGLCNVRIEDVTNLAAFDVIKLYVSRHKKM